MPARLRLSAPISRAILCAAIALPTASGAQAQSIEAFYKGKTISIILFTAPGSIYDTYARLLSRYLPRYLAGQPTVIVKSMPGAGGLRAARHLNEVAPRDGTTIGGLSRALIFEPMLGKNVAQVDYRKFGWLGSMSQSTAVYVSWKGRSKVQGAQDLFTHELLIAGTGAASETAVITTAINGIVGTKIKLVQGYAGSIAALLALERGEVDGGFPTMEALKTVHPDWLRDGKLNLLFQTRQAPDPEIDSVPTVISLAKTEEQRQDLLFLFPRDAFGRPYVTPPGLPADRLKALQDAFAATVNDSDLIAETEKLKLPLALTTGSQLETIIKEMYATPPEVVERVKRYMPKD